MNFKLALILTPALFMLSIWVLALSSSVLLTTIGLVKLALWAALMSYGAALSVTIFVKEIIVK